MSNINAESVKTKLQSLIAASNAKTGKSDTNLTDAVNTLIEGYGQGGGDCPINIVDELPATGEEGEIVVVKTFADVVVEGMLFSEGFPTLNMVFSKATTTTMRDLEGDAAFWYLTDIPDIYVSLDGVANDATSLSSDSGTFKGEITDISQATEDGYYAYMSLTLYQYTNGEFKELVPESELPTEVATEAEMTALLSTAEVGSIYKYTGTTTDTYENGALYMVEKA